MSEKSIKKSNLQLANEVQGSIKSIPKITNLEIHEIEKELQHEEEKLAWSDSSEEWKKQHPIKVISSSSSSSVDFEEEDKMPMNE